MRRRLDDSSVPGRSHLRSLTSLRFLASLLVFMFHVSSFAPGLGPLDRLMASGYVGVTFFFTLSGFVLTFSWEAGIKTSRFYRRRFARIYPVHLLFVIVATLPLSPMSNWSALPENLLLIQSWWREDAVVRSFSGVSWSLSCEMFFYAVFPLLARWLRRVRRPLRLAAGLLTVSLLIGVALEVASPDCALWLFHLPAFRLVEFTCGGLIAIALKRGWLPLLSVKWAVVSVVVSYLTVLCLPVLVGYRVEDRWALTLAMVPSFGALIAACAHGDLAGVPSLLQGQTMVSLGEWSFCVYMAHPVVIALTAPLLGSRSMLGAALGCIVVTFTVIGAAYLLHATVERPMERLLRGAVARVSRATDSGADIEESVLTTSTGSPLAPQRSLRRMMNRPTGPTSV